jgi:hypothetical protein
LDYSSHSSFPFVFEAIGWKFYTIHATWDVLQVIFVAVYWVETIGLTLEQIDDIFLRRREPGREMFSLQDYSGGL